MGREIPDSRHVRHVLKNIYNELQNTPLKDSVIVTQLKTMGVMNPAGSAANVLLVAHVVLMRLPRKRINISFFKACFQFPLIIYSCCISYHIVQHYLVAHVVLINISFFKACFQFPLIIYTCCISYHILQHYLLINN